MKLNKKNLISVMNEWGNENGVHPTTTWENFVTYDGGFFKFDGAVIDPENPLGYVDVKYHFHRQSPENMYGLNFLGFGAFQEDDFLTRLTNLPLYLAKNFNLSEVSIHNFDKQPETIQDAMREIGFDNGGSERDDYKLELSNLL